MQWTVTTAAVQELLHILSNHAHCRDAVEGGHSAAGKLIQPSHSNLLQRASSQRVVTSCGTSSPCAGLGCGRPPVAGAGREHALHPSCFHAFAGSQAGTLQGYCSGWHHSHPQPLFSPVSGGMSTVLNAWANVYPWNAGEGIAGPQGEKQAATASCPAPKAGRETLPLPAWQQRPFCGAAPLCPTAQRSRH